MPTTRPRHILTETDDLAAAIDAAAEAFPGESRADVLRRLVGIGVGTLAAERRERERLVRQRAGRYAGVYSVGYLDALRAEWPE